MDRSTNETKLTRRITLKAIGASTALATGTPTWFASGDPYASGEGRLE